MEIELGKYAMHIPFQVGRANCNFPCCWSLGGWLGGWLGWLAGWLAGWLGWLAAWGWGWSDKVYFGQIFQKYDFLVGFWYFFVFAPWASNWNFSASSVCSNYYFLCFLIVLKLRSLFVISYSKFGVSCTSSLRSNCAGFGTRKRTSQGLFFFTKIRILWFSCTFVCAFLLCLFIYFSTLGYLPLIPFVSA